MASFTLPVLLAVTRGYSPFFNGEQIEASRWTEVLDKFWTSVMFVLFAIYPYSACFFVLYPFGIPVFMHFSLR